ncbi:MAG TPA: YceI family protein [Methylomirabilota bacterium]|nr:YceI family protein [Methylomirabilota bacterium]
MRVIVALLLLALAAAPCPAEPAPLRFRVVPEASELGFHATSRLANADGRFSRFDGEVLADPVDLSTARVSMKVEAASIDTGIRRRDDHLRSEDFLHVDRFPAITFQSTHVEATGRRLVLTGRLTLRGVTKEIVVSMEVSVTGDRLEARGQLDINRGDYGINYHSSLNPIGQRVRIRFAFRAQAVR